MKSLQTIDRLINSFTRLPSVGKKSAERMAYAVLNMNKDDVADFVQALNDIKTKIHQCPICGLYTEEEICEICSDNNRDKTTIIVVSSPKDVVNFEKLGTYNGLYHVLNGNVSAIKGIGINDLNIDSLIKRIDNEQIHEIILATDPTMEGETTALYIAKLLENKKINITRLAYGLPMGGRLDYADSLTISKALEGRKKI